jgi:hypothetical protein
MRKTPHSDPDPADPPVNAEPAASASADRTPAADDAGTPTDDHAAPSLVWPPVDDELNDWEVLHVQSTGHTIIEPMKVTPPAGAAAQPAGEPQTFTSPTPAPYVPPEPLDDPAGETSLVPVSNDRYLPETELIEPLTVQPELPARPASASDDRTVVIPRPAGVTHKPELPAAASLAASPSLPSQEDTNPGVGTKILVAPAFAASVGHAPTVPVSALHRGPRPQPAFGPRNPMEDTLPAGVTREMLAAGDVGDVSDETVVRSGPHGDTHPVPFARHAAAGPAGPPAPFSRVPSRAPQAVVTDAAPEPAPISLAQPPLAFGPRGPASGSSPSIAPVPFPVPSPAARDVSIPSRPEPTSTRSKLLSIGAALVVALLLALGAYQWLSMRNTAAGAPTPATLSVESSPEGAVVAIDGTPRGKTPLRLELSEGDHVLEVSLDGATRNVPLTLAGGTVTAHSFEFAARPAPTAADAAIEIRSEPAGGRVLVDGIARGATPIVVTGLTAGRHEVQVSGPFRTVTRTVTLGAGQQARLIVTPARTPPAADASRDERPSRGSADTGYVAIQSPIPLRVVRNGDFVGTSEDARLSLPAGPQVIGLENESVGFRDVRTVEVVAGKVTPVSVSLPKGEISINARPWAEVFVDGTRVGETPVSQLSLPVGMHEIVFRHPDLGERRVSVVVKIGAIGRAFTDFTK